MSKTATQTKDENTTTTTPAASSSLWRHPIEIIGLTGEFASGKTLFGLTVDPKSTLVFDEEKSSAAYTSLGFDRVDLFTAVQKHYDAEAARSGAKVKSFQPVDVYLWWLDYVSQIPDGKYRVIMLDTVGTIEAGLADWVDKHPEQFGHNRAQYVKMTGIFWGDVKSHWKFVLNRIASKCETFVFTSHMANVYKGAEPTGKRKPKGKETLMELASLYLQMERKPDAKGNLPAKPSAVVLKSRLMSHRLNESSGEVEIVPTLPPRLPVATPHAIRQYMQAPPDYSKLSDDERVHEERMSEDERLQLQASTAQANRDAEQLRLDRQVKEQQNREANEARRQPAKTTPPAAPSSSKPNKPAAGANVSANAAKDANVTTTPSATNATGTTPPKATTSTPPADHTYPRLPEDRTARLVMLRDYKIELRIEQDQWKEILAKRDVTTATTLTDRQLNDLILKLRTLITSRQITRGDSSPAGQADGRSFRRDNGHAGTRRDDADSETYGDELEAARE